MIDISDRIKIFISYSRRDLNLADRFVAELEGAGFDVTIDRRDLPYGEEWQGELADFIRSADCIIWLISDASVQSKWCNWEVGEVVRAKKRLIPVAIAKPLPSLPEALGKIHVLPASDAFDFPVHFDSLVAVVKTNRRWVKEHSRLADRAREWLGRGRIDALLLRGAALRAAEQWKSDKPHGEQIADEVLDLLLTSRQAQTRRGRILTGIATAISVGALLLAGIAVWQWGMASQRERLAQEQKSRYLTAQAGNAASDDDVDLAKNLLMLARDAIPSAGSALPKGTLSTAADINHRDNLTVVVDAGNGELDDAALSPDGSRILTVAKNGAASLWDVDTGLHLMDLPGKVSKAAFSPDGRSILVGWTDNFSGSASLLDAESGRPIAALPGDINQVERVLFSPSGRFLAATTYGGTVRVWNGADNDLLQTFETAGTVASFSADETLLVTGSDDGQAIVWELASGKERARFTVGNKGNTGFGIRVVGFRPHSHDVIVTAFDRVLTYTEDGRATVSTTYGGHKHEWWLYLWSGDTGDLVETFKGHKGPIYSAAFSKDGTRLLTASFDETARIWDVASGRESQVFWGHSGPVYGAEFSSDEQTVLTAGDDATARLWNVETGQTQRILRGQSGPLHTAEFGGSKVLTAATQPYFRLCGRVRCSGYDPTFRVWDSRPRFLSSSFAIGRKASSIVAADAVGDRAGILSVDGKFNIWSLKKGTREQRFRFPESITVVRSSPDRSQLLTASLDGSAALWDSHSGRKLNVFDGDGGAVWAARYSPDGSLIILGAESGKVKVYQVENGQLKFDLGKESASIFDAGFSPDGKYIYAAPYSNELVVWDTSTGRPLSRMKGHSGPILGVAFLADGKRIVTASDDQTLRIWDIDSGTSEHILRGHSKRVNVVGTSADGKYIVSGSDDGSVIIWSGETGRPLHQLVPEPDPVNSLVMGPSPSQFLMASSAGRARLVDLASGETLQTFEDRAGRGVGIAALVGDVMVTASERGRLRLWELIPNASSLYAYLRASATLAMSAKQRKDAGLEPLERTAPNAAAKPNGCSPDRVDAKSDAELAQLYWSGSKSCKIERSVQQAFLHAERAAVQMGEGEFDGRANLLVLRANLARRLPIADVYKLSVQAMATEPVGTAAARER
jgi:WD40 repeat protein